MTYSKIENITSPFSEPLRGKLCTGFFERFRGLMFDRDLPRNECIILDEGTESKLNTSIHMFFMFYDITTVWADKNWKVVDIKIARKWKPYYAPTHPARYVLEARTEWFEAFHKGDQLRISNV